MSINFTDTIVARRLLERGISTIDALVLPAEFMGRQNKKQSEDRLKLAGDLWMYYE